MHNASIKVSDLSASMLLSCPWWALCFDPLTSNSGNLSLHSFLSAHLFLCSSFPFLWSLFFDHSCTNSTYCLPLSRPPLPLAPIYSPSLSLSLHLSHFPVALVSQPVCIMWSCYVLPTNETFRLIYFSLRLVCLSFLLPAALLFWVTQLLWQLLQGHVENLCLRRLLWSGYTDYQAVSNCETTVSLCAGEV